MLYRADKKNLVFDQGKFKVIGHQPGFSIPNYSDHGYGPLALIAESFMAPDTWIRLHPHHNDEIISWVPEGIMRHNDVTNGPLITDKDHLMIMNAGTEFWHEERTLVDDPPLRMLQIFVRPHEIDLKPQIQHGPLAAWVYAQWRKVFGPENSGSPFYVRNDIEMYDLRVKAGETVAFPVKPGYSLYFMVYTGAIQVNKERFGLRETGLLLDEQAIQLTALEESLVVAFAINPKAKITKSGTVGR
jgi:redox-sensitive bicupin YhaK (pirin superfamily)